MKPKILVLLFIAASFSLFGGEPEKVSQCGLIIKLSNGWSAKTGNVAGKMFLRISNNNAGKPLTITLVPTKMNAPVPSERYKVILKIMAQQQTNGDVQIVAFNSKKIDGYYFVAKNAMWEKHEKLRNVLSKYKAWGYFSLGNYMIQMTIDFNEEKNGVLKEALSIVENIDLPKSNAPTSNPPETKEEDAKAKTD